MHTTGNCQYQHVKTLVAYLQLSCDQGVCLASDEMPIKNVKFEGAYASDARNGESAGYFKCKDIERAISMLRTYQIFCWFKDLT